MYEHHNRQGEVYIIKEKDGERELIFGNDPELIAGALIKCANLSQLDILKFLDYSREKKTLENK